MDLHSDNDFCAHAGETGCAFGNGHRFVRSLVSLASDHRWASDEHALEKSSYRKKREVGFVLDTSLRIII